VNIRIGLEVAAIALALAAPAAAFAKAPPPAVEADRAARLRMEVFDQVWSQIDALYYDPGFNGADWSAARARYRPRVAGVRDDAAFGSLLRAMVGELRDAHTRVLTARQAAERRARQTSSAGVILFEVDGRPAVFSVRPGSPAAEAGVRPGLTVLAVGGLPVDEALARAKAEVGASSSERAARVLAYLELIAGAPGDLLRLRLSGADGTPFEVALPRRPVDTAPRFESRRLPSGDLYVRFDRFRAPVARLFRAALEQAPVSGLVLDLRSNTGGDGGEGMKAIAPLLDRPMVVARLATRTGKAPSALMGLVKLPLELKAGKREGRVHSGPVVILVNEGSASTTEVIAAGLQEHGRARIVGTRSCGCALGVLKHRKLKDGRTLAISEVGLVSGLGRRIEGEGVVPDLVVAPTLADLREGKDPALDAAVAELKAMRARTR
jgi:carboxyl-terminal processing protease